MLRGLIVLGTVLGLVGVVLMAQPEVSWIGFLGVAIAVTLICVASLRAAAMLEDMHERIVAGDNVVHRTTREGDEGPAL